MREKLGGLGCAAIMASAFVVTGGSASPREIKSIMHRKTQPITPQEPEPIKTGEAFNKAEAKRQRKAEKRRRENEIK